MRTEITKLHQRLQATMIYVTHDQVEAMTMGTRIVVMKDGIIQQADSPLHIYHRPANMFVAGFLGSPPMNFLHGALTSADGSLVFRERGGSTEVNLGRIDVPADVVGDGIVLGIRPEHCDLVSGAAAGSAASFEAEVELVEPMGAETYLYAKTAAHSMIIRSQIETDHSIVGQKRSFFIDAAKAHLFKESSGERLN